MSESRQDQEFCQYYYPDLAATTSPDPRKALRLRRVWWRWKRYAWYIRILGPIQFLNRMSFSKKPRKSSPEGGPLALTTVATDKGDLNLQPGEIVEVRSEKEIFATLDRDGKLRGLRFTPEMSKYCGRRFRVYKLLRKIIIETTGEMRTIKSPTVLLKGVICDGSAHGGCDRACFCFWRETWLKRVDPDEASPRTQA
jgi:hypothetical protein